MALILSRSFIMFAASEGIELMTLGILPAGILALAALVMAFLRNFSFTCGLSVTGGFSRRVSTWSLKDCQSALLKFMKVHLGALFSLTSVSSFMWIGR